MTGFVIFGTVHDVPDNFKQWVKDNGQRIKASEQKGTLPYFLKDNEKYWKDAKSVGGIVGNGQAAKVESSIVGKDAAGNPVTHEQWYGTPTNGSTISTQNQTQSLFTIRKEFDNGGVVQIMDGIDKGKPDYKDIITISTLFAKDGETVKILASTHFKSDVYKEVFGSLIGTKYERKCPDLLIGDFFYEYESYESPWNKRKISNMLSHGLKQSSRIIIDNNKGASDRFIRKSIIARLKINNKIDEVWIYEKGNKRLFFKDGEFIKNNKGD